MTNEEEKAIESVKIIQQYCDRNKHCSECIFGKEVFPCGLHNRYPYDWDSLEGVKADDE